MFNLFIEIYAVIAFYSHLNDCTKPGKRATPDNVSDWIDTYGLMCQ